MPQGPLDRCGVPRPASCLAVLLLCAFIFISPQLLRNSRSTVRSHSRALLQLPSSVSGHDDSGTGPSIEQAQQALRGALLILNKAWQQIVMALSVPPATVFPSDGAFRASAAPGQNALTLQTSQQAPGDNTNPLMNPQATMSTSAAGMPSQQQSSTAVVTPTRLPSSSSIQGGTLPSEQTGIARTGNSQPSAGAAVDSPNNFSSQLALARQQAQSASGLDVSNPTSGTPAAPSAGALTTAGSGGITIQTYTPVSVTNPINFQQGNRNDAPVVAGGVGSGVSSLVQGFLQSRPPRVVVVPVILGRRLHARWL